MKTLTPHRLPSNVIEHFYRGGERIAELRGHAGPLGPEEWLASTVTRWGTDGSGLTDLGPAGLLRDLVAADPEGWLGAAHVARWGASTALLVKLLDAGERLPVHLHPNRSFVSSHLGCPFGKTEAGSCSTSRLVAARSTSARHGRSAGSTGPSSSRRRRRTRCSTSSTRSP